MSKKTVRTICLILIFAFIGAAAVSCKPKTPEQDTSDGVSESESGTQGGDIGSDGENESKDTGDGSEDSGSDADTYFEILVSELENYSIIYPEGASDDIKKVANELATAISEKYGVVISSKNDSPTNYMGESQIGEYEIILGDCRRDESQEFLSALKYGDRGYKVVGKKLVVASHDAYTTLALVSELSSIVRAQKKDNTVIFSSDMNKIYLGRYTYETMTVGGVDISEYRIVYPKTSKFDKNLAQKLWRAIAEECGAVLTVVDDSAAAAEYEILIGETTRISKPQALSGAQIGAGSVSVSDKRLILCGNGALGNAAAVESVIDGFKTDGGSGVYAIMGAEGLVFDKSSDSSMSFNLTASGKNNERVKRVVETIVRYLPDTVGLQECSADWKNSLLSELGDYYEFVGTGRDVNGTGLSTGILYAKDKLTLLDSGTRWMSYTPDVPSRLGGADANYTYTWAKFKNSKSQTFMVLNTQLGAAAAVRAEQASMLLDFMYENRDVAIVLSADLGCAEGSEPFNTLVCEFMRHSAAICADDRMGAFTHSNLTDTLLVYDKYIDVSYMEVAYNRIDGAYASDSRAAYIEYLIDMSGTDETESGTSDDKLTVVPDRDGEGYLPPELAD